MIVKRSALAVLALVAACGGGGGAGADVGDRLPDVEITAFDITALDGGESTSLSDIDGPAVVNLWATWCVPCRTEIPEFEAVHRQRGDEVRFVGINIGEDAERAAGFLAEVGATYDQYRDPDGVVSTGLDAPNLPVTVVIDADGVIRARRLGTMDQDALVAAIDDALGA
jgi:cytochrome c biogenesis protein CcmG, thiol:disulfide interchange protein DsbE